MGTQAGTQAAAPSARQWGRHSIIGTLVEAPWWMTVLLGAAGFFTLYVVMPGVIGLLVFSRALPQAASSLVEILRLLSSVVAAITAILALLSHRHARERRQQEERQRMAPRRRPVASPPGPPPYADTIRTVPPANGGAAAAAVVSLPAATPRPAPAPVREWSLDALRQLEWKRFELLCVAYYEAMGFKVKTVPNGPDGGVDATLYKRGQRAPLAVVQCKAWNRPVKVEQVRALGGAMLERQVGRGVFWSLSGYVGQPVQASAERAGIQLLDGEAIVARIRALPAETQAMLMASAFEGDFRTPSCAACGVKLVARHGKAGPFWGCANFPRCRVILPRAA
ncbi:restriction endonuclease [Cupriavidus pauculus]|nr:restriction endonuclease [Cupriavidus pauculus]